MESSQKVVTRFAPSPTGKAHAGSYRTAMYAWLFARNHGGKFILRIEDTDTARNDKESERDIYDALQWLGIDHDELYIQSQNLARHQEILKTLIDTDKAYISREEAKDGSGVMKDIIRFRNPGKSVTFNDLVRGPITTDTADLGDFVIARNINEPLYHLAVVVDDHDEGVTHVIRAEEHIANTPRQILIHEALGWKLPEYAHIAIVLGPDKQKLSKRKGALPMTAYASEGYLPDAVFNCIAMIGWNPADPGSDQELFTKEELIKRFDFGRVQKSGAVFNIEKLDWFNREYIKMLDQSAFWTHGEKWVPQWVYDIDTKYEMLAKIEYLLRDRIEKFSDIKTLFDAGEFDYFFKDPEVKSEMLVWKQDTLENAKLHLAKAKEIVESVEDWNIDGIKTVLMPYAQEVGKGNVLWPLRVALSGREKSPDPFEIASIIGKEKTLARIDMVLK
jgi:glutamyl-tRNA synthetase